MGNLDDKINEHFEGLVVRKDLVKTVKGNAIVPSYVLEYLFLIIRSKISADNSLTNLFSFVSFSSSCKAFILFDFGPPPPRTIICDPYQMQYKRSFLYGIS